nr:MAG TPA: envelope protein [Caudoviricetes sp.]
MFNALVFIALAAFVIMFVANFFFPILIILVILIILGMIFKD